MVVWLIPVTVGAPSGMRPAIPQQRIREYTYAYSAVCPEDGDNFSYVLPYADTERMKLFLEALHKHLDGQPVLLIMDQAAWHKTYILLENCSNIIITFQPPYSPELNPVENFWAHIREKYFANRFWDNLDDLENHLAFALDDCSKNQKTIRSLSAFHWL